MNYRAAKYRTYCRAKSELALIIYNLTGRAILFDFLTLGIVDYLLSVVDRLE